jgi:hypothetical protein
MKQMKKRYAHDGYIMIFTLLIVAASMVLVTYVGHKGALYVPFSHMVVAREKAKMIALGGIQVAIAQLAKVPEKDEKKEAKKEGGQAAAPAQDASKEDKDFLQRLLPVLNRWQVFHLEEKSDAIDAELHVCIMCEDGKININRMIDFEKGTLRSDKQGDWKLVMQELCKVLEKTTKTTDLFQVFEKIVKERKTEFNDATELITRKEFSAFKDILFYEPPSSQPKEKAEKKEQLLYLMDIFTTWSSSDKIEPWLFSDSINGIVGFPRAEAGDVKKRKEQVEGWLKNFKQKANWEQDWKTILMPVYGKELRSLPKNIDSLLSTTFAPRFFSVLVHGKVGEITQRLYAILERNKDSQDGAVVYNVIIKKLYWL